MVARRTDILIVGGGQAGRRAAEGARAVAPEASIAIIGAEAHPPYDRPPLSKEILLGKADPSLCFKRDAASYEAQRIALLLNERVTALDLGDRSVRSARGVYEFGKLILATGSRARILEAPAAIADRVTTLRTLEDAQRVAAHLHGGARVVVIGAGFIGLEVASAAVARGANVTVLEAADRVLARVFPAEAGARVEHMHREAGVDLRLGVRVLALAPGVERRVRVDTDSGAFDADLVVVGIGVCPNVELAVEAGLDVEDGILVSAEGATSHPDVFAAGEVTAHPLAAGGRARLESWQIAEVQAEAAGRSAAGAPTAYAAIPYFWSDQLGANMQMFGLIGAGARIVERQDKGLIFFAIGLDGRIQAAIGFDAGAAMSAAKRLIGLDAPEALGDPATPLRKLLRSDAKE